MPPMITIEPFLVTTFGVLANSIWLITTIAVIAAILLRVLDRASPVWRYRTTYFTVILLGILFVGCFASSLISTVDNGLSAAMLATEAFDSNATIGEATTANRSSSRENSEHQSGDLASNHLAPSDRNLSEKLESFVPRVLPSGAPLAISISWLAGVVILIIYRMLSIRAVIRIKNDQTGKDDSTQLRRRLNDLRSRFDIKHRIGVATSQHVLTPVVIGVFRPMILVPRRFPGSLSNEQIDAVLSHEVAHIKRRDFFSNLILCWIECVYFFHPAMWWLARVIRHEREQCCDQLAISKGCNRIALAEALVIFSHQPDSSSLPHFAKSNDVSRRIQRILFPSKLQGSSMMKLTASSLTAIVLSVSTFLFLIHSIQAPLAADFSSTRASQSSHVVMLGNPASWEARFLRQLIIRDGSEFSAIHLDDAQPADALAESITTSIERLQQADVLVLQESHLAEGLPLELQALIVERVSAGEAKLIVTGSFLSNLSFDEDHLHREFEALLPVERFEQVEEVQLSVGTLQLSGNEFEITSVLSIRNIELRMDATLKATLDANGETTPYIVERPFGDGTVRLVVSDDLWRLRAVNVELYRDVWELLVGP